MYGKTVDAVLLKGVGNKLFLVHHVFGEGALHTHGVCPTFNFILYTFNFQLYTFYYSLSTFVF